jgi:hypothetical protein
MYIVAIGWLYVTLMMAITEPNMTAGVLTFLFYGLAPCALVLWLFGGPSRQRAKRLRDRQLAEAGRDDSMAHEQVNAPDRENAKSD